MKSFVTCISASYRPQALCLVASLRQQEPDALLHVLVTDGEANPSAEATPAGLTWIELREISTPFPPLMPYYFDGFELCNALKPFAIQHLFEQGITEVIYLDTDIMAVGSFDGVREQLIEHPVIFTPHVIQAPKKNITLAEELGFADLGVLNGGFSAWRDCDVSREILNWMCERFPLLGFCSPADRMFVDQKLLPLIAMYWSKHVKVTRDPTLNIAYWNAHERSVEESATGWHIAGQPVVFFHLSGWRITSPTVPCAYQTQETNRQRLVDSPWLAGVLSAYATLMRPWGDSATSAPYGFAHYKGTQLTPRLRRLLFKHQRFNRFSLEFWRAWLSDHARLKKRQILTRFRAS